jgi:hypothetical protein
MSKYDLPPNLKGPAARRTARAALGERMAARTGNEPAPTPPPFSEYSRAGAVPEPPAISGPRNYHVPSEAPTKRQRADLSPGMRARLIEMIGRARAAFAESRAAGDRRQSLIQDLMAARQQLKDAEDGEARRSWLQRKGNPDQATLREIEKRGERVKGLEGALERVTIQQNAAHQRACALRSMVARIARPLRVRPGQVMPLDWEEGDADLDTIEERLYEQN